MKTGRNDSCPCGSEKKYKKCCLFTDESRDFERKLTKKEFKSALEARLADRLKTTTFSEMTVDGSKIKFDMELAINGYPFEVPEGKDEAGYEALISDSQYMSGLYDDVIDEVFLEALKKSRSKDKGASAGIELPQEGKYKDAEGNVLCVTNVTGAEGGFYILELVDSDDSEDMNAISIELTSDEWPEEVERLGLKFIEAE